MNRRHHSLTVTIYPGDESGRYTARFRAPVLGATFSAEVADNITGAVALNAFADMLRSRFGRNTVTGEVEFVFSPEAEPANSRCFAEAAAGVSVFSR